MVNKRHKCQMLFEHRTEMDKCIVLHQHFYQIIHEKTFLMKFDESQQKFDEIWPKNILMSHQKICPISKPWGNFPKCVILLSSLLKNVLFFHRTKTFLFEKMCFIQISRINPIKIKGF